MDLKPTETLQCSSNGGLDLAVLFTPLLQTGSTEIKCTGSPAYYVFRGGVGRTVM